MLLFIMTSLTDKLNVLSIYSSGLKFLLLGLREFLKSNIPEEILESIILIFLQITLAEFLYFLFKIVVFKFNFSSNVNSFPSIAKLRKSS